MKSSKLFLDVKHQPNTWNVFKVRKFGFFDLPSDFVRTFPISQIQIWGKKNGPLLPGLTRNHFFPDFPSIKRRGKFSGTWRAKNRTQISKNGIRKGAFQISRFQVAHKNGLVSNEPCSPPTLPEACHLAKSTTNTTIPPAHDTLQKRTNTTTRPTKMHTCTDVNTNTDLEGLERSVTVLLIRLVHRVYGGSFSALAQPVGSYEGVVSDAVEELVQERTLARSEMRVGGGG